MTSSASGGCFGFFLVFFGLIREMVRRIRRFGRPRKIVRGPRGTNFPPGSPNLSLCPNDFSLQATPWTWFTRLTYSLSGKTVFCWKYPQIAPCLGTSWSFFRGLDDFMSWFGSLLVFVWPGFAIHDASDGYPGPGDGICWSLIVRAGNEERPSPELVAVLCIIYLVAFSPAPRTLFFVLLFKIFSVGHEVTVEGDDLKGSPV